MGGPTITDARTGGAGPDPTLEQRVEERPGGPRTVLRGGAVVQVVAEVAAQLDALHRQGRTHGDVRAARIAAPPLGPARLLGPERPDPAGTIDGDVTGLVCAAFFALTGDRPNLFRPLSARAAAEPPLAPEASAPFPIRLGLQHPGLRPEVSDVFGRGLSPQQADRFASAGEFAAALRGAVLPATGTATAGMRAAWSNGTGRAFRSRLRFLVPLAACALLGLGLWLERGGQAPPQAPSNLAPPAGTAPTTGTAPGTAPPTPDATPQRDGAGPAPATAPPAPALKPQGRPSDEPSSEPQRPPRQTAPLYAAVLPAPGAPSARATATRVPRDRAAVGDRRAAASRPGNPAGRSYLRVYARQFVSAQDVLEHRVSFVRPRRVLVDGSPSRSLAAGLWTRLPPGSHELAFYPAPGVPFDPNTKFWVRLGPRRRSLQIPLPRHPGGIQRPTRRGGATGPV